MAAVPDLDSPSWDRIAKPLLAFISRSPASIKEILERGRQSRMGGDATRSALAWLSLTGKAYFDDRDSRWKAGCILAPPDIYVPSLMTRKSDTPVNMEMLLRFLDSHPHRRASPFLRAFPSAVREPASGKKSPVRTITFEDRTMTIGQWARETGLSFSTLAGRLDSGWPPERILKEPCHVERRHSIVRQISPACPPAGTFPSEFVKPIRTITIGDKTQTICQWEKDTGISFSTLSGRLARGWPPERILEKPRRREPVQMALDLPGSAKTHITDPPPGNLFLKK
jgi:lambda repressor-like predicted transcriptional regulator